jgi:hypothetical protein
MTPESNRDQWRTAEGSGTGLPPRRPAGDHRPALRYRLVASVFDGDRAITFWLRGLDEAAAGQVVSTVKVSHLDFAGDGRGLRLTHLRLTTAVTPTADDHGQSDGQLPDRLGADAAP